MSIAAATGIGVRGNFFKDIILPCARAFTVGITGACEETTLMHARFVTRGCGSKNVIPSLWDDVPKAVGELEEPGREAPVECVQPVGEDTVEADGRIRLNEWRRSIDLEDGVVGAVVNRELSAALLLLEKHHPKGVDVG